MNQAEEFLEILKRPDIGEKDICEHLDTLRNLASECTHVTEMGFRTGTSFIALMCGKPQKLITYDIRIPPECKIAIQSLTKDVKMVFHEASTLNVEIEPTDLLFIDTLHTFNQLEKELALHGNKAKKYLVFHDTITFGTKGEDGTIPGLMRAIMEFIGRNEHWHIHKHYENNNGLTVLKRCPIV